MHSRFVLRASGDQFLFNLKAGNNEVVLTSERYTAKSSASAPGAALDDETRAGKAVAHG